MYHVFQWRSQGVTWVHVPRRSWNFFSKYNRTRNSTQFVTIHGYVQSKIQHVSPASGRPQTPFFVPLPLAYSWLRPRCVWFQILAAEFFIIDARSDAHTYLLVL